MSPASYMVAERLTVILVHVQVDAVIESCERLFSSPIPPNMARHGMRSLTLWILAVPLVLTNAMPPLLVALWSATTAFIYLGVDELGSQVRAPHQTRSAMQPTTAYTAYHSRCFISPLIPRASHPPKPSSINTLIHQPLISQAPHPQPPP